MTHDQLVGTLQDGFRPAGFSLSPDSTTVVFGGCTCAAGLATVSTDGSDLQTIPGTTASDTEPSSSPDGTRLAFVHYTGFSSDITTINHDGTNRIDLTNGMPQFAQDPRWSPNGDTIVFWGSTPEGTYAIYTIPASGGTPTRITYGAYQDRQPAWSPDGRWIAFGRNIYTSTFTGPSDLWLVRPNGSGARQVTFTGAASPEWSPQGELAYGNGQGLAVLQLHDGHTRTTTVPGPYFVRFNWVRG